MKKININTPYITLGQFLKYVSLISSGAYAKEFLQETKVYVNNELETRRGRKLYEAYQIKVNDNEYIIGK